MAGGEHEYMASFRTGVSDITPYPKKYYDTYLATSGNTDYGKRILDDATGEIGLHIQKSIGTRNEYTNWYQEQSSFIDSVYIWFYRGGNADHEAIGGIFGFAGTKNGPNSYSSSRLVLSSK